MTFSIFNTNTNIFKASWKNTICPDGNISQITCENHLILNKFNIEIEIKEKSFHIATQIKNNSILKLNIFTQIKNSKNILINNIIIKSENICKKLNILSNNNQININHDLFNQYVKKSSTSINKKTFLDNYFSDCEKNLNSDNYNEFEFNRCHKEREDFIFWSKDKFFCSMQEVLISSYNFKTNSFPISTFNHIRDPWDYTIKNTYKNPYDLEINHKWITINVPNNKKSIQNIYKTWSIKVENEDHAEWIRINNSIYIQFIFSPSHEWNLIKDSFISNHPILKKYKLLRNQEFKHFTQKGYYKNYEEARKFLDIYDKNIYTGITANIHAYRFIVFIGEKPIVLFSSLKDDQSDFLECYGPEIQKIQSQPFDEY
jgi:hypothetical protein